MNVKTKKTLKLAATCLFGIVFVYFLVNLLVADRLRDFVLQARLLISEQETVLTTIAEITARNGADSITERIIQDCTLDERSTFDDLLNELDDGLSQKQLTDLERLFGRCGGFYAQRKAIMSARLARETEIYQTYVQQLSTFLHKDISDEFKVKQWNNLAKEEQEHSKLFSQLVSKQDEIISTLLAGKSADSAEISAILTEVTEIKESLFVKNKQIAATRAELISF